MERGRKGLLAVSIILPESGLAVTGTLLGLLHGDSTRVLGTPVSTGHTDYKRSRDWKGDSKELSGIF